ncbi:amino acid adenylation domain-containing protein, partial [Andreprevotia lacus DSM 23236]
HTAQDILIQEANLIEQGREAELPAPVPFRNFVAQARLGVSEQEHEQFFTELLGHIDEPTAPFGLLDVQGDGSDVQEASLHLPDELSSQIRQQARSHGVSAASLMHLAWALVLARTSGRDDVVFGTVLLGRMQGGEHADRVMGMFINTLPVRLDVGQHEVEASLKATHKVLAQLLKHEHAPLALAQRCSGVVAPAPLFTALLNYRHASQTLMAEAAAVEAGSQQVEAEDDDMEFRVTEDRTNYPVTLSIDDLGEGFHFKTQATSPIAPDRINTMMLNALQVLLEALTQRPRQLLTQLDILPRDERQQVLDGWNTLPDSPAVQECLHELFEAQAALDPHAVALQLGEQQLSYGELNAQANQLAYWLRGQDVAADTLVAICVERGFAQIVALLAVLKAGGAYVPLDPAYASDRLRYTLEDAQPALLLLDASGKAALGEGELAVRTVDVVTDAALWQELPTQNLPGYAVTTAPHHLAYVIYTSGSTGKPKGVMVEHRNVVRLFGSTDNWFGFGRDDVWSLFHSFSFDFSVWEIWGALLYGGKLVIVPLDVARSPVEFYDLLCSSGVTVLNQTPSAFLQLSAVQANHAGAHALRRVIFGGEALELRTLKPWYEREQNQQTELINMYGITETTVHVTYRPLTAADAQREGASPIGGRIPDLSLYILDTHGLPAPVGVIGELYVGGAGVARGYLNRPELTAERFIANPFSNDAANARLYKTGDLGRWLPDGTVEYLGRNDFQVKIRGFRIELGEIEAKLAHCPDVREVVVLAREDSPGDKRLVAYYLGDAPIEELRTLAIANLPPYMVPAAYVRLDSLPLTPNGKLDRRALPAPEGSHLVRRGYEAPIGETEAQLAQIWAELLGLSQVGRNDNFFELGGHSLLAIRLVERMRSASLFTDIRTLFSAETLADLAAATSRESDDIVVPENLIPAQPHADGAADVAEDDFEEFRL